MGLVREEHPCWVPTCDRCGEGDNAESGGSFHYSSEAEAVMALGGMDWHRAQDGSWLCYDCYDEARTEQYACPHGAGCTGRGCVSGCGGSLPVPFSARHDGGRREVPVTEG